jgi:hypothetical protein
VSTLHITPNILNAKALIFLKKGTFYGENNLQHVNALYVETVRSYLMFKPVGTIITTVL